MIKLLPDSATQTIYVTPFQARKYLPTFTHYLIQFKMQMSTKTHVTILKTSVDNERYTAANIATNAKIPSSSSVLITDTGFYTYTIWGQNSSSNTNPEGASVVGECEVGVMQIKGAKAWTIPTILMPNNVVYYE
tara:strand:+ start:9839 stop:10240 length:402 start_codon:yes stop_codon:yes gene_type:complete